MSARRVGVMGGTFDPIHRGHLDAADAAQRALNLTELLVVTSHVPPHRPAPMASSYHRFAMTALAVAGRPGWQASDLELKDNAPGARSFTSATLQKLHAAGYAALDLFFVIGADAFADIESWVDYPAILDYASFVVVARPGHRIAELGRLLPALAGRMVRPPLDEARKQALIILLDAATSDVSSTAIRERRARGESIVGLVPDCVRQHIEQHGLYSSHTAGRLHGQD
jgi:nicotinate-nucleotide adenylyltransferase